MLLNSNASGAAIAAPSDNRLLQVLSLVFRVLGRWPWLKLFTYIIALSVVFPLLLISASWLDVKPEVWSHLIHTVLGDLLRNTLVLSLGVTCVVFVIGVSLAWFTTMTDFPGRRWFDWALMLPMSVPAYVMAFVFLGVMDYSGPIQTVLRYWFGADAGFNERGDLAVIFVMSLVLYPYVYMLARSAFLGQGMLLWESARSLGAGPWRTFFTVSLPMARPAIIAGVSLAVMETLADFGAVAIFNYDTFTTAIYKAWYGFFDISSAAQLASLLLLFVFLALFTEKKTRGNRKYYQSRSYSQAQPIRLGRFNQWLVSFWCLLILSIAFLMPVFQLGLWSYEAGTSQLNLRYLEFLWHSTSLAGMAAVMVVALAVTIAYAHKLYQTQSIRWSVQMATMGYALPGSVLAVGIMVSFSQLDLILVPAFKQIGWTGPVLVGSLLALLVAYAVRFMAVAVGPIESSVQRIIPSIPEAARSLGASPARTLFRVYLPMLAPGIFTAMILVFVDVLKEMPATLLLRPFGWDTLGVKIYEYTSEGEWELAAIPGLTLIVTGLIPVIILIRQSRKR